MRVGGSFYGGMNGKGTTRFGFEGVGRVRVLGEVCIGGMLEGQCGNGGACGNKSDRGRVGQ